MRAGQPRPHTVVIGCGALGRELVTLTADLPGVDVTCLPALLHNRPDRIPSAVADRIAHARWTHGEDVRLFVAYADCGTGGLLDAVLAEAGVERLAGAHCYEVYAGSAAFAALHDAEPGTFYLTDFLARQFDTLVWSGLGLDRHPELLPMYFGNYRRLVYLAQTDDAGLTAAATESATRLGLDFERRFTGFGELGLVRTLASLPPVRHASGGRRVGAAGRRSPTKVSQERLTKGENAGLLGSSRRRVRATGTGGRKAPAPGGGPVTVEVGLRNERLA